MPPVELENTKVENFKIPAELMAKYFHDNKFDLVIVNGASAQTGAYLVKQAWKRLYPHTPMPKFGAIGRVRSITDIKGKHEYYESIKTGMLPPELKQEKLKQILGNTKPKKIVIFEESTLGGGQLKRTKTMLEKLGHKNIAQCSLYTKNNNFDYLNIDFVASVGSTKFPEIYLTRRREFDDLALTRHQLKRSPISSWPRLTFHNAKRTLKNLRRRAR
jgi:hypothetical protein